jgi:hypothetical protein
MMNGKAAHTHPAKLLVFSRILDEIFGVKVEDIIPGIEKKLGSKLLGVRGSIDLVFSGFILELKIDLEKENLCHLPLQMPLFSFLDRQ